MDSEQKKKIRITGFCGISFLVISYLVFRTPLSKSPNIFLYNLIILIAFHNLGFYRGLFFTAVSVFLTLLISFSSGFYYAWNIPFFFLTFFLVNERLKRYDYYTKIIDTRIGEITEKINVRKDEYLKHGREALTLERKEQKYELLKDITSVLSSSLFVDDVSEHILESTRKVIGKAESLLLFLVDTDKQELHLISSRTEINGNKIKTKKGDIIDESVFKQRQCMLVEDIRKDFRFSRDKMKDYYRSFRSLIAAPLIIQKKVIGILRMEHSKPYTFTSEDLRLLDILCDLGAVSLQNSKLYRQTLDLAITDGLTDLYLRRYFMDRLREELLRSLRHDIDCSLLMIDIDYFKKYNDKYGHTAGDIVLKTISHLLKNFSDEAVVARYGGEEFSMLLPETPKKKARKIAEDIRKAVKKKVIELRRVKTGVTVSIGLASFLEDSKVADELIHKADENLYKAKRTGKDKVVA